LGAIRPLRVKEVTKIGAFLDWGLEKDLFLPFKEQLGKVKPEKSYLVALYIDKSKRLCATMKIGQLLSTDHFIRPMNGSWQRFIM
jgi:predicted RNA-binding protein (virulence factor B family)